jgi:hypothetical protein
MMVFTLCTNIMLPFIRQLPPIASYTSSSINVPQVVSPAKATTVLNKDTVVALFSSINLFNLFGMKPIYFLLQEKKGAQLMKSSPTRSLKSTLISTI